MAESSVLAEEEDELEPEEPVDRDDSVEDESDGTPKRSRLRSYRGRHLAQRKRSFFRELPILVLIAFITALLLKTFIVQAFYIPSASMEPTLRRGDRVIVEKVLYRFGEPSRGDVVVFSRPTGVTAPDRPFWSDVWHDLRGLVGLPNPASLDFIKRVIGVGGDSVEAIDGRVLVNGSPIDEPYLLEGTVTEDFDPIEVPEGMLFVMGDNRGNSEDSRRIGPISLDQLVGHAFVQVWPPSEVSTL